jgi:hypothetical protein
MFDRAPWGYAAREIVRFLADAGYSWFALADDGSLSISSELSSYNGNLVALPHERFEEFSEMGIELASSPTEVVQQPRGVLRSCREYELSSADSIEITEVMGNFEGG